MAILQTILTALTQSLGRILNTAFSWATVLLFGKVDSKRQTYLSIITLLAVVWLVVLVGVVFPSVATFLLAFVPLPSWVEPGWVRLVMLIAVVILPLAVGALALFMMDPADRPRSLVDKAKAIIKGYPFTIGLALTMIMLIVFAPMLKIRDIIRRWSTTHVPIVVSGEDYLEVVGAIEKVLADGGIPTERYKASWMIRMPTRVLTFLAGGSIKSYVAEKLTTLKGDQVQVMLHPSDLVISGKEHQAAHAHALITAHLTFTKAHLTWSKDANKLEDRLGAVWQEIENGKPEGEALGHLKAVAKDMDTATIPYEEWETLFRERLQVERRLLRHMAGLNGDEEVVGTTQAGSERDQ